MTQIALERVSNHRAARWLRNASRELLDQLLLGPLQEGRLEVAGMNVAGRLAVVFGLAAILGVLISILAADLWRGGELVRIAGVEGEPPRLMPLAALPPALLVLAAAWALTLGGAVVSSQRVRIGVAVLFLLANGPLSRPLGSEGASLALRLGPEITRGAYLCVPAILLLYSLPFRRERWLKYARPVTIVAAGIASFTFFGSMYWLHADLVRSGGGPFGPGGKASMPSSVDIAIRDIQLLLLPLFYASGVAVAEFAYDVAAGCVAPFQRVPARVVCSLLVALLALKLVTLLYPDPAWWVDVIRENHVAALHTGLGLAFFVAVAVAARRLRPRPANFELLRERIGYGGTLIMFLPPAIGVFLLVTYVTAIYQLDWQGLGDLVDLRSGANLERERTFLWFGCLVVGAWLLRYRRYRGDLVELAFGLIVVSVWGGLHDLYFAVGRRGAFNDAMFDLFLTTLLASITIVRFRRLTTAGALHLAGIALTSWLIATQFGIFATWTARAGISDTVVVVFGVVFALFTGSAFARGDSPSFPRASRPLIWVGYLLISVTLLNWLEIARTQDPVDLTADIGLFYLGFPIAAWAATRRAFSIEAPPRDPIPDAPRDEPGGSRAITDPKG